MKLFLQPWAEGTAFTVGEGVLYNNTGYYCITAHTATASFDATKFRLLGATDTWSSPLRQTFYSANFFCVDAVYLAIPNTSNVIDDASILRYCTGGIDLVLPETVGNRTYTAQGDFMGFSTITEEFDVKVGKFEIFLSGLTPNLAQRFTSGVDFEGCKVVIMKVFLDYQTLKPINNVPVTVFEGQIFNAKIVENYTSCDITIECATLWADFERKKGRRTNNESNWLYQSGNQSDLAFSKTNTVGQVEYKWGRT